MGQRTSRVSFFFSFQPKAEDDPQNGQSIVRVGVAERVLSQY